MYLTLLNKLIAIRSQSGNEKKLINFLYDYLLSFGFRGKKQIVSRDRYNLLLQKGQGEKSILLYSHVDTVGITRGWKTNPFKLALKGDRAHGLGSWDMKGGMTTNILTFLNYQPKKIKLKLVFCVDEENISKGGWRLINSDFMENVECIISPEPAFKFGLAGIVVGRIGRAIYQITITCPSQHFAYYNPMIDPNQIVAELILKIKSLAKQHQNQKQFVFVRKIQTETQGMSLPQKIMLELDSSVLPPTTHKQMLERLSELSNTLIKKYHQYFSINVNLANRDTPYLDGYRIDLRNRYLRYLKNAVRNATRIEAKPYFRSSVADDNIFATRGFTVLGIGPEGGNAHGANEWVSLSSLGKLYKILNKFLITIDK